MVKKSMKKLFVGLAVLTSATAFASSGSGSEALSTSKGFFQPRAASANIAREMMMQPGAKHRNSEGWYGEFSATAFYQRNWNQAPVTSTTNANSASDSNGLSSLGAMPFWSGTNVMIVGNAPTTAATVPTQNVDSYQFGLGTTTANNTVTLNPLVYQAGSDFMFIVGSSANEQGFFAKIKAPIAVYNINPQLTETTAAPAANYVAGALDLSGNAVADSATSMTQAFAGVQGSAIATGNYSVMQYGLIDGDQSTGAKFGDIEMTAGYSFVSNDDNSFSVAVRASAPTGNKATGKYMLEPIVGRGGNWGLGGYAAGHVKLWEGNNDNRFTFKFMSDVMHLFTTDTVRSYDLTANGAGSRYLLVANYANGTYQSSIQNLINVSTLASQSSFGVEGDVAVAFNYAGRGWTLDVGYEFYGRSAEELTITGDFAANTYVVLGHQGIGQVGGTTTTASFACQPGATMLQATAPSAVTVTGVTATTATMIGDARLAANTIAATMFDVDAAQQSGYLSSKIFSKVAYEWENSDYVPFLGVLGEFEFSNSSNNALPQWSVAIVGGVSF